MRRPCSITFFNGLRLTGVYYAVARVSDLRRRSRTVSLRVPVLRHRQRAGDPGRGGGRCDAPAGPLADRKVPQIALSGAKLDGGLHATRRDLSTFWTPRRDSTTWWPWRRITPCWCAYAEVPAMATARAQSEASGQTARMSIPNDPTMLAGTWGQELIASSWQKPQVVQLAGRAPQRFNPRIRHHQSAPDAALVSMSGSTVRAATSRIGSRNSTTGSRSAGRAAVASGRIATF